MKIIYIRMCDFSLLGTQGVSEEMDCNWWLESCHCLNNMTEAVISLVQGDPALAGQVLLADKGSLAGFMRLFQLELPQQLGKSTHISIFFAMTLTFHFDF